ncbi:hypothetical protein AVEN_238872-1 [Araneus ventricosus]|uniref:Uncharacterized protein n=1 Tax=Araneus ventricosus TaxID=182803 RepID=A0A4Y2IQL6_ARAVE|nr:hypothetical protein AVEN_238872-1 [Araneus ventricosus]
MMRMKRKEEERLRKLLSHPLCGPTIARQIKISPSWHPQENSDGESSGVKSKQTQERLVKEENSRKCCILQEEFNGLLLIDAFFNIYSNIDSQELRLGMFISLKL